jgi:hypothetical protein
LAIDSLNRVFDISLENGNTVSFQDTFTDADADATNELQSISQTGDVINISDDPSSVDLSQYLDNTDDQSISGSGFDLSTNDLTIGIEDGLNETVNLSALDNSGTDDQSISGSGFDLSTNDLTIGIENGLNETVDLSALDNSGTDDQTLAIDSLNRVFDISLENGNTVSFQDTFTDADADATNELQSISGSGFDLSTNDLTIGIEDGLNETVNLSVLDNSGTDDQSISGSGFNTLTNDLTIGIENGLNETVDLSALDNSGSWTWNGYSIDNSTSINTLGGNGLTVNSFSETSNSVTTDYELGTPSTITGSTTNGTTSSSHTHALDFAIGKIG